MSTPVSLAAIHWRGGGVAPWTPNPEENCRRSRYARRGLVAELSVKQRIWSSRRGAGEGCSPRRNGRQRSSRSVRKAVSRALKRWSSGAGGKVSLAKRAPDQHAPPLVISESIGPIPGDSRSPAYLFFPRERLQELRLTYATMLDPRIDAEHFENAWRLPARARSAIRLVRRRTATRPIRRASADRPRSTPASCLASDTATRRHFPRAAAHRRGSQPRPTSVRGLCGGSATSWTRASRNAAALT